MEKSLSTLDLKRLPPKAAQQVRSLLEGGFVDRHDNVLIFGNPGSGKTHVACAIGQELIRAGRKVMFATCGLMVQDLLAAKRDLKLRGFLKKISQYHVMILDDIGYVQYRSRREEVLRLRDERGSVVLTSNLAFSVGDDLQGPDDDRCGDRSPGAPQRDPGVERSQLSGRASQEGRSETVGTRRSKQGGVTESKQGYRRGREGREDRNSSGLYTCQGGNSNCRQKGNLMGVTTAFHLPSDGACTGFSML